MGSIAMFAEVIVRSSLGRGKPTHAQGRAGTEGPGNLQQTFHYSIPPHWQDCVVPGQLVWVPFGARQLPGIVLALSPSSPVAATRDILGIIDPQPVLAPYQIALMRWISQHYRAPLRQVAWSMFPSGISWQAKTMVHLEEAGRAIASHDRREYRVLSLLRENGPLSLVQLQRKAKIRDLDRVLGYMARKGWVRRQLEVRGPQVRPKAETVVSLSAPSEQEAVASLSRAPKQRAVLEYLQQRAREREDAPSGAVALSVLCEQVGVKRVVVDNLAKRGLVRIGQREVRRDPLAGREFVTTEPPKFTSDQEAAWRPIADSLESNVGRVFLLHGVTGSGKTEIYLRALAEVLQRGGQGIALVPEIALTPQTIRRFQARFPGRLAILHSGLSEGERYDEWRRIRAGLADIVIGPRSAAFAPLPRLRLIVVDEEHEWTYKQQDMPPYYHARDVAAKLAELVGGLAILGSATPDVTSYYRARQGEYTLLRLPQRIMGHRCSIEEQTRELRVSEGPRVRALGPDLHDARYMDLPPVEVVDLRAELRAGNRSMFSRSLQHAMHSALAAREQVILFLNRRGAATFIMCRDCGHVVKCPRCEVALSYHADSESIVCHHCNRKVPVPASCPQCLSERIRFFGIGTQTVEQAVHDLFPQTRILRWDRDVTGGKNKHEEILDAFVRHEADVLVGTQMIAKGLDLPLVTLVGVVTADTILQLPDFRANERTFQLLTQVAGRAGRSILGGKVIIQSYAPHHFCIQAASRHDYEGFYEQEVEFRRRQGYPPFKRLVRLLFKDGSPNKCEEETLRLRRVLDGEILRRGLPDVDLIGPAPCWFERIRGQYRWHLVIRGSDPVALLEGILLPSGWHVDVDPVSLL